MEHEAKNGVNKIFSEID